MKPVDLEGDDFTSSAIATRALAVLINPRAGFLDSYSDRREIFLRVYSGYGV